MKGILMLIGAVAGAWRRGLGGALLGAGVGWTVGALLTPARSSVVEATEEEEHYVRYPEEEIVDALQESGDEAATEGAELDDLYREVTRRG